MAETSKTLKYLLFFFNFLFWLCGIVLIVIGALIKVKYGDFLQIADAKYADVSVFILVIGIIVTVMGFLGCCGAIRESYCMLVSFAAMLSIIFIMQIIAGSLGFAYRGKVETEVDEILQRTVNLYDSDHGSKIFMDWAQKTFECCGNKKGASDYKGSAPSSCDGHRSTGCNGSFKDFIKEELLKIGAVAIAIACVQILGIIFSGLLAKNLRDNYEVI